MTRFPFHAQQELLTCNLVWSRNLCFSIMVSNTGSSKQMFVQLNHETLTDTASQTRTQWQCLYVYIMQTLTTERNKRMISEEKGIFWLILHRPENDFSAHLPRNWQNRIRSQKGTAHLKSQETAYFTVSEEWHWHQKVNTLSLKCAWYIEVSTENCILTRTV